MGAQESHAPQPGPQASATLRWCCDEAWLPFASTDEVEPLTGVVGQDDALEALRFGLEMTGPGQHVFVRGLAGTQGVIIPQANRGDLMLRPDVVTACEAERFHVYAVATIHQALELLTGRPAGHRDPHGQYPEHTLLRLALDRARDYWRMAAASPADRSGSVGA